MSWQIYDCLEILDPEVAPQVLEFSREVTRKRSLEQLGFDLVESADIDDSFSFNISGSSIWWSQFSGNPKDLYTAGIMKEIVNRFPETPFVIGDGYDREYVKGDFRERLVKHTLDVGVDNPEAFARLSAVLNEEQYKPFFLFPLGELLISKVDSAIEEILARVSALVPGEKLYCVLVENETVEGDLYSKKGVTVNSHIVWQETTGEEIRAIERTAKDVFQCYDNKPDEAVFRCLFDETYFNEIAAEIAREDAERAANSSLEHDDCDLPL